MSDTNVEGGENNGQSQSGEAKEPYQKPSFQHERVFETMALVCGKLQSGSACSMVKKTS